MTDRTPTISVTHLFPVLDDLLLQLLRSLTPDEWNAPTIARLWKVKDIAAHLLDGNIRAWREDGHAVSIDAVSATRFVERIPC